MTDKKLTKEEAQELYDDLSKAMSHMMKNRKPAMTSAKVGSVQMGQQQPATAASKNAQASAASAYTRNATQRTGDSVMPSSRVLPVAISNSRDRGQMGAIAFVVLFSIAKITVSAFEASGVGEVVPAQAAIVAPMQSASQWSKEEVKILTALDRRRAELEERNSRLEQREHEFAARDRDLAVRLTELKELTESLKIEREKGDKHRNAQLDQLANVYGSMNPPEAAHLLEQLDINIAHSLIQRMPEKRIGQILALMNAQRALELTNRLSSKSAK